MDQICPCGCGGQVPVGLAQPAGIIAAMVPLQNRLVRSLADVLEAMSSERGWRFSNRHYRLMQCDEHGFEIMLDLLAHANDGVTANTRPLAELLSDLATWKARSERLLDEPDPALQRTHPGPARRSVHVSG